LGVHIYIVVFDIAQLMQLFVLGPRLILSVREYSAKLVANADAGYNMTTIAFEELVQDVSTGSTGNYPTLAKSVGNV